MFFHKTSSRFLTKCLFILNLDGIRHMYSLTSNLQSSLLLYCVPTISIDMAIDIDRARLIKLTLHPRWDWKWMTKNRASSNSTSQGVRGARRFFDAKKMKKKILLAWTSEIIQFIQYPIQMDRTERSNFFGGKGWLFIVIQLCYSGLWPFSH